MPGSVGREQIAVLRAAPPRVSQRLQGLQRIPRIVQLQNEFFIKLAKYLIMRHRLLLLATTVAFAATVASAQPAGYIKNVAGQATVTSAAGTQAAAPGMALGAGDTLRTGADGSLGVVLRDNTVLSFGPATLFTLEDYQFEPAQGALKLGARVGQGSLHYVSGAIAKLRPQAVEIKTPTGVIGVRGTRFVVVVQP
jgi:hypothetical protein